MTEPEDHVEYLKSKVSKYLDSLTLALLQQGFDPPSQADMANALAQLSREVDFLGDDGTEIAVRIIGTHDLFVVLTNGKEIRFLTNEAQMNFNVSLADRWNWAITPVQAGEMWHVYKTEYAG